MIKQSDVTIIIPHYGASKEMCYSLQECLLSLKETVPDIQILVAKNGGIPCTCHWDINLGNIQGQCKAVNAAVATTDTPWIFITNDDMVYPHIWFETLTKDVTKDRYWCISPKLIEPQPGAPTFETYFCGGAGGDFDKKKFLDFADKYYLDPQEAPIRTGFNFPVLIKRELWDLIEAYDINYDPWGSNGDSDLEYKIRLAGIQPYQNPNCIVYHFSQTSGTFEPRNDNFRFKNYAYFKEKWGFDRTDNGIWEANFHMPTKGDGRIFTPEWEEKYGQTY